MFYHNVPLAHGIVVLTVVMLLHRDELRHGQERAR